MTKLEDEETDSTSTILKIEDLEGQLSGEIKDLQIKVNSFQDVEIEIPFQNLRDELFENSKVHKSFSKFYLF